MAYYEQGLYECVIVAQGFDVSRQKKTPCFWLRFVPAYLDGRPVEREYEREIRLWLTDNTVDSVVERLGSLGWTGTSFKELEPGGFSFKGVNVELRCTHNQDGDKVYEDWEFPAPGNNQSEHQEGVAKKLDALFGKALKGGQRQSATATTSAEPESPPIDDDVPF